MDGGAKYKVRLRLILAAVALVWVALAGRLFYLQVLSHQDLAAAAVSQYQVTVEGLDTRGMILDRNGVPLTGGSSRYYYFLFAEREDEGSAGLLEEISARLVSVGSSADSSSEAEGGSADGSGSSGGSDSDEEGSGGVASDGSGSSGGSRYRVYYSQTFDSTVNNRLREEYGAYVFSSLARYGDEQTACHLIGYLNQAELRGVSGLELACEDRLKAGNSRLTLWADSGGSILLGVAPQQSTDGGQETDGETTEGAQDSGSQTMAPSGIVTTLDIGVQKSCETALAQGEINGAVSVSEASTGQILAWASSPTFNPNRVASYLEEDSSCLVDKCIQGTYAPGSVFKVVVAAAALEKEDWENPEEAETSENSPGWTPETVYNCQGEILVEGVNLGCRLGPEGGHGKISLFQAMAQSCNCYFAWLGQQLGYEAILDMAKKLGFGSVVMETTRFEEEAHGNLPRSEETGKWDVANLSIGQGALLVTPMQIQKMMSIVASGGIEVPLSVVKADVSQAGSTLGRRLLSTSSAALLEALLLGVMTEGTGSSETFSCPVFGKTGTAEGVSGGEEVSNCWFSGYCQVEGRKYVVTVLVEQGKTGSTSALPVFQEICDYLVTRNFTM